MLVFDFGFGFSRDKLEVPGVEQHLFQQQVLVKLEAWVTHLEPFVLVVVALDDAELTGQGGLPIPALSEWRVGEHGGVAVHACQC